MNDQETRPDVSSLLQALREQVGQLGDDVRVHDTGLVKVARRKIPKGVKTYAIPATQMAEKMGVKMMANIIMLGFVVAVTGLISYDSLKETIQISVPKGTEEKTLAGMEKGFLYGRNMKSKGR